MTYFFEKAVKDERIITSHVSLFAAICQCWQNKAFAYPIPITRRELMKLAKIASYATYPKCMRELIKWGISAISHPISQQEASFTGRKKVNLTEELLSTAFGFSTEQVCVFVSQKPVRCIPDRLALLPMVAN